MFYDMEGNEMSVSPNLNREIETQHHKQIHDFKKNLPVFVPLEDGDMSLAIFRYDFK